MTATTRWWWVRHAPVDAKGRIYGQHDIPADCSDPAPFRWLAEVLPCQAVWVVSPLTRARQTAEAIRAHVPPEAGAGQGGPEVEPAFLEQHFGDWQGRSYDELDALRQGAWHRFWLAPAATRPPGGESFADVVARVAEGIERRLVRHGGEDIVVVAHSGPIRAAVALALDLQPDRALSLAVDTCSLTCLDHIAGASGSHDAGGRESWRVRRVNLSLHSPR